MHDVLIPTFGLPVHTAIMLYISAGLVLFSLILKTRLRVVPGKVQSIVELIVEIFVYLGGDIIGEKGKKFVPLVATFFLFILISNAMGLIPGLIPPTADLNTTVGLALVAFAATHIIGLRAQGLRYLRHFAGPSIWLSPLMIPIEIIGHLARPLSLSLRLFGNMMGHEKIVMVALLLMPAAYPLLAFSTLLGVIVVVIQAFVFSLLTMVYIGGALEEGQHH